MSATFTIKVTGIRTTSVGDLADVVKQVEWVLVGEEQGQKFELPQATQLPDPSEGLFIPLAQLTEAEVIAWIEANDARIPNIKAHIQHVLDKEVAKAVLVSTPIPWQPIVETPTTTTM